MGTTCSGHAREVATVARTPWKGADSLLDNRMDPADSDGGMWWNGKHTFAPWCKGFVCDGAGHEPGTRVNQSAKGKGKGPWARRDDSFDLREGGW